MAASNPRDVGAHLKTISGVAPVSTATTVNGPAIDRIPSQDQMFMSCVLYAECGTETVGTVTAFDAKLQESADGATGWTDVSGAAITQQTAHETSASVDVDLSGTLRYVRVVTDIAGGTAPVAATVVLGGSALKPPV